MEIALATGEPRNPAISLRAAVREFDISFEGVYRRCDHGYDWQMGGCPWWRFG
jgi:hypothetical protein